MFNTQSHAGKEPFIGLYRQRVLAFHGVKYAAPPTQHLLLLVRKLLAAVLPWPLALLLCFCSAIHRWRSAESLLVAVTLLFGIELNSTALLVHLPVF